MNEQRDNSYGRPREEYSTDSSEYGYGGAVHSGDGHYGYQGNSQGYSSHNGNSYGYSSGADYAQGSQQSGYPSADQGSYPPAAGYGYSAPPVMGPTSSYLQRPSVTFLESCEGAFRNYAKFDGRASRSEFWWPFLGAFLVSSVLSTLAGTDTPHGAVEHFASGLGTAFSLITVVPTLSLTARRLHDTDRSGWWQLLWLIPFFGWIPLIMWLCQSGKPARVRRDGAEQPWLPSRLGGQQQGSSFFQRGEVPQQQLSGSMASYSENSYGYGQQVAGDGQYSQQQGWSVTGPSPEYVDSGYESTAPVNLSKGNSYGGHSGQSEYQSDSSWNTQSYSDVEPRPGDDDTWPGSRY